MILKLSPTFPRAKKPQNPVILGQNEYLSFWAILKKKILKFWKMSKNWNFQKLLQPKLCVLWKNFWQHKMRKMFQKIHFWALKVAKTTSRWIFWQKSKTQNFGIFDFFKNKLFSRAVLQALEKIFVFQIWKIEYLSFHTHFQVLKKILKLANLCLKEVWCQKQLFLAQFRAKWTFSNRQVSLSPPKPFFVLSKNFI